MAGVRQALGVIRDNALSSVLSTAALVLVPWHDRLIQWLVRHVTHIQAATLMLYLTIAVLLLAAFVLLMRKRLSEQIEECGERLQEVDKKMAHQEAAAAKRLASELAEAKQRIASIEKRAQQALASRVNQADYQELQPAVGITVFTDKQPPAEGQMPRWYCARCLTIDGKLSTLQANHSEVTFDCHECGGRLHLRSAS